VSEQPVRDRTIDKPAEAGGGTPPERASRRRQYIRDLTSGKSVDEVYLVAEKSLRANRSGGLYLQLELRDRTGTISCRMWNASERVFNSFQVNDFLRVRGRTQLYQGELQLIVAELERVPHEEVDLSDFLPQTPHDIDRMQRQLEEKLHSIEQQDLAALAEVFLEDHQLMDRFATAPAAVKYHHAYRGGLLEHVVTMMEIADRIVPLYPELDRDLLLMGIFLHDIGKVAELSYHGSFQYTDEGELLGHVVQGLEILGRKIAETEQITGRPFPRELATRLKHMIVSHHGQLEFGSPKEPRTLEAVALHFIDNMDSRLAAFRDQLAADNGGRWTEYVPMFRRRLYRGTGET